MLLLRALNNYDITANPLENGIASKQMLFDIVKNYYNNDKNASKTYLSLNDEEKEKFIIEHIEEYLRIYHNKLENKLIKNSNQSREDVKEYRNFLYSIKGKTKDEMIEIVKNNKDNINFGSYITFMNYISGLQRHLLYGSSKITDWISTSTNIESMFKYYDKQSIHRVAVIKSNTGGLIDSDNILSVDLSTFDKIRSKSHYLCNQINIKDDSILDFIADLSVISPSVMLNFRSNMIHQTNLNSRGFKYSTNSKEVCILKYIPKSHIISVLEALQIDLLRLQVFDTDFVYEPISEQMNELKRFKFILSNYLLKINDSYLLYVFDELYNKNNNLNSLVRFNQSKTYIENNRNKILSIASKIPSSMIKR